MKHWIATMVFGVVSTACIVAVSAESDSDEHGGFGKRGASPDVAPVASAVYKEECGACHFPYQPGLLPARSWERIMAGLDRHFGDNAELPPDTAGEIGRYLAENAADKVSFRRSLNVVSSLKGDPAPLRITDVPYIRGKHRELRADMVKGNPEVKSLSNCGACHTRAERGYYSERDIRIPGFGRWED